MAASSQRNLMFHSDAVPDNTFEVLSFHGSEAISRPFNFDLEFLSIKADVDFTAILKESAWLGIRQGIGAGAYQVVKIHGVIASIEQLGRGNQWIRYRATLMPKLWRMSLTAQSQLYLGKTVPEIIEKELKDAGLTSDEYEFQLTESYPVWEQKVQYLEPNLGFLQRLCEHDGIFYYFKPGDTCTKVVFSDSAVKFPSIQGNPELLYRPAGMSGMGLQSDDWMQPEVVKEIGCCQRMIPKKVVLRDYNYRTPSTDLKVELEADSDGIGTAYYYGEHYKNETEGRFYAKIRAEELSCRKKVFRGTGNGKSFRAGGVFNLKEHYRQDFDGSYLLTEVQHHGQQPIEDTAATGSAPVYWNSFVCIPASAPFRPERTTPKPLLTTLNATVDAGGSGEYAEIDDQGRYKIKVPFDLSGLGDGKASRYIRMAQPYSGSDYGFHCPLHKGAEVVLTHVNNDPDRPIIAGSIPNPEQNSPVDGANQSQCVLRSGGGNELAFEDTKDAEYASLTTPGHRTHISLGKGHSSVPGSTAEGIPIPAGCTIGTEEGVSIAAGKIVSIAAGSLTHDNAISNHNAHASMLQTGFAVVGGILAAASTLTAEYKAVGHLAKAAALADISAAALGGVGSLWSHTNAYISSPTKVAIMAGAEVLVEAALAVDIFAIGCANLIGGAGAFVGSAKSTCVVALKDVEVISIAKDVKIEAKNVGNVIVKAKRNVEITAETEDVKIEAQKNVKIETKTEDVKVEAHKDLHVKTVEGKGTIEIHKNLLIESKDAKKIEIKAGTSSITLDEKHIYIKSDSIVLETNDGKAKLALGTDASYAHGASLLMQCKEHIIGNSTGGEIVFTGDKKVKAEGKGGVIEVVKDFKVLNGVLVVSK